VHAGAANLRAQLDVVRRHGVTPVVAVNAFPADHPSELAAVREIAAAAGARCAISTHYLDGGAGATELAEAVVEAAAEPGEFAFLYPQDAPLREKIAAIATDVYGADGVDYTPAAARAVDSYQALGYGGLGVCVAKTHLSVSADPALKGAPTGWRLPVREVRLAAGAGFVYPICGDITTMPGLASASAAESLDVDDHGRTVGLF
jgi:formate--tetrahydrofolate ligase